MNEYPEIGMQDIPIVRSLRDIVTNGYYRVCGHLVGVGTVALERYRDYVLPPGTLWDNHKAYGVLIRPDNTEWWSRADSDESREEWNRVDDTLLTPACIREAFSGKAGRSLPGSQAAVATLERLGYTYHGGQEWKPPLGQPPADLAPRIDDWDEFYLGMASYVSRKSKDPSTRVGAVIVRPDHTVASVGYNGFPRGANDDVERMTADREWKLARTIHAEKNAIHSAYQRLTGCTIYVWPMPPCSHCAADIAQAGIMRVVAPDPIDRWRDSCEAGRQLLQECGVRSDWIEG